MQTFYEKVMALIDKRIKYYKSEGFKKNKERILGFVDYCHGFEHGATAELEMLKQKIQELAE